MDFPRKMMDVDGLLFEAEQAGVKVWLKEGGGGVRVRGRRSIVGALTERLRPIKQDVVAYLELAALVAHYCAAIKSQLGKPYAPDDAQELKRSIGFLEANWRGQVPE